MRDTTRPYGSMDVLPDGVAELWELYSQTHLGSEWGKFTAALPPDDGLDHVWQSGGHQITATVCPHAFASSRLISVKLVDPAGL